MKKMMRINGGPIRYWSFSVYAGHVKCPYRQGLKSIAKREEKGSDAMARGNAVHEMAERYVKGELRTMPLELTNFAEYFKDRRQQRRRHPGEVVVEETLAFRRDWTPTAYNDWDGCWVRIKADIMWLALEKGKPPVWTLDDYKTGKFRQDEVQMYMQQLELQALGLLLRFAKAMPTMRARTRLLFLDQQVTHAVDHEFTTLDVPRLKKLWEHRTKPLLADKAFRPKPGTHCRWCDFRAAAGGPCVH